jgi:hypothetical protein
MALRLLVLLQVGLLSEVDSAGNTVEWSDTFVNALVHVAVTGRCENLERKKKSYYCLIQAQF